MSTPNSILNELNNLDSPATLKILFCVHFTLTTFSLFGALFSQAYMFYNSFLLIFLLWAQYSPVEKSDFPLFHSMIINGQALLFDIIMLTTGYSFLTGLSTFGFIMCILHMLVRIPSTYLLYRIREQRRILGYTGEGPPSNIGGGRSTMPGYEDLPSSFPRSQMDSRPLPP